MPSGQLVEIILKARDEASNTAKKVEENIKNIGKSSNLLSKVPGLDGLKTKLGNVASTIDDKFGGALTRARQRFSNFKSTVTNVGSALKGKFGGAVDGLRAKLQNLRSSTQAMGGAFGFLKGAASMTVGMIGYDLVNSIVESTRASLNARSSIQAFGTRLQMSASEVSTFQKSLDDLQGTFKKVDMDVVGQQAMDMAYRLGLPKESLTQLTETSAIFTDAMQRNGRSAEDATLALADAMDGEFKRLKEIGISQDDLMKNGWSGDINDKTGLLNAMNKALKEQHYDELAKSVDTLDDAWQVLSITLGNLLESVLLPITPAIVGVITGITDMINGFKDAWNGLPDFAQLGIGIGVVATAIGLVALVLWTTYIPAWWAAATATWAAIAPILPIVLAVAAVIGLLVVAVYEVGKAFGWWTDVGSMIDAIWAGLQRLWNAFINHPDVQAAIAAISSALSTLWSWIQQAGQAILEFFGVSTSGDFDIVRALIDGIGVAWQVLTGHIRAGIQVVQMIISGFQSLYNGAVSLGSYIGDVLSPVFSMLSELWNSLVEAVQPIVDVFQRFSSGQTDLLTVITTVASTLWNLWVTLSANLGALMLTLVSNLLTWATQAGLNVLTGIATYLMQVPVRVATYLAQTLARIISYGARWVTQARAKASQLVNGVISFLRQLPGRALSALLGVVSSIVSAGAQWISNAKSEAGKVVTGVYNKMAEIPGKITSALSGVASAIVGPFKSAYDSVCGVVDSIKSKVSDAMSAIGSLGGARGGDIVPDARGGDLPSGDVSTITKPFTDAYNSVEGVVDNIISKASEVANISLPAFGGDAWGEDIVPDAWGSDVTYTTNNENLTVDINHNVTLDLVNVPAHISTATLIEMLSDRDVLNAFVNNRDFQSLDARVKERINYKANRSRGV